MCRIRPHSLYRVSILTYAFHPLWSGSQRIHASNIARAFAICPIISSMCMYLYQNWSTRGRSFTARSHTFLAWLTNLCAISISAYLSHRDWDR